MDGRSQRKTTAVTPAGWALFPLTTGIEFCSWDLFHLRDIAQQSRQTGLTGSQKYTLSSSATAHQRILLK